MPNETMIPPTTTTIPAPSRATQPLPGRPLSRQQRQAQARQRARNLLRAGYTFAVETPTRWRCNRPASAGGGSYAVDVDRLTCSCAGFAATGTCSHLLLALDLADAGFNPSWLAGACPLCGGPMVRNEYHLGGRGYLTRTQCWWSLRAPTGEGCPFVAEVTL